jgi:hypothetical protein
MEDQISCGVYVCPQKEDLLQGDHQSLLIKMVRTHGHLASGNVFDSLCLMLFRIENQTKVNIITNWLNSQLKNPTG